jgi:hypothetical protein
VNLYSYAGNNPIAFSDPYGLDPCRRTGNCTQQQESRRQTAFREEVTGGSITSTAWDPTIFVGGTGKLGAGLTGKLLGREGAALGAREVAAAGVSDAVGFTSRSTARQALGQMGLSDAQAAAANRAIGRATTNTTIEITQGEGGSVVVRLSRPGRDGYQVVESVITEDGTKTVTQYGVNAQGTVVHIDPKN